MWRPRTAKSRQPKASERTDEEWLRDISDRSAPALEDLRRFLVKVLENTLRSRVPSQSQDMAQDIAQDALLSILEKQTLFRGEARFTTWCAKIAVRHALTELRRSRWKDVPLQPMHLSGMTAGQTAQELLLSQSENARILRNTIQSVLTDRQQTALIAVMQDEMPIGEVAERLGTNRNALYKMLHDARQKLRKAIEDQGLDLTDFATSFG